VTIFVGEAITVVADARNPARASVVISDAMAQVEFYAPGSNPAKVPADRVVTQGPFPMAFDSAFTLKDGTLGAYVGYVDTTGWPAGRTPFRVTLSGSYDSWEYSSFNLVA
jgi:hypothetical protein